ncbi:MAG: hypothetical protein IKT55_01570 [Clostridia bacterium]|nr:hypothetical protein [Clostridia bacterium]
MKKFISLALCVLMLFSAFSVCSVAADKTFSALSVKATDVVDGKVTYNIYLEPNVHVNGAIVFVEYDEKVLEPILPETYSYTDKKTNETYTYPGCANGGAFVNVDEYGDSTVNIGGLYAGGKVHFKSNVISVGYTNENGYKSSARKGMFTVDFKVIDTDRPVTKVAFKIVEFQGADEELNVTHNTDTPATFKTISTDTFEKTIITGVTPTAKGMQVNWKATEGADYYNFYKKTASGWAVTRLSADETSYIDTTAQNGVKETYAVRAFKNDGRSFKTYNKITGLYVAPPAKVTTANSGDGVKVSWSAVSGADSYRVFKRVTNADGSKTSWMYLVKNTTAKSYVDTNVANDVKYEYLVRANMDGVYSANSVASAIYHYDAPTVKIASAKGGAKVTWNVIDGAETYKIYRRNNGASAWTLLKTVNADTLSYLDAAATSGKKLDYTVRAFSSKGSSNYIAKTINYVATPKLTSLANGTSGATLKWSAVKGATTYRVYRKVVGAKSWTALADVKTTSYVDKTAKSGTKYAYTVKAFNGKVASGYDSTGLTLKYLVMPKITKLTNTTAGINIKWSATTGASTGYKVYRKAPGETSWKLLGTVKTTSYTDKKVANGKTYKYTIRAVDGSNLSAYNSTGTSIKRVK